MANSYDPKCRELAEFFLKSEDMFSPEVCHCLAIDIQTAVEDFLERYGKGPYDEEVEHG